MFETTEGIKYMLKFFPKRTIESFQSYRSLLNFSREELEKTEIDLVKKRFLAQMEEEKDLTVKAYNLLSNICSSYDIPQINSEVFDNIFEELPAIVREKMNMNGSIMREEDQENKDNLINIMLKKIKFDLELSKKYTLSSFSALSEVINDLDKA